MFEGINNLNLSPETLAMIGNIAGSLAPKDSTGGKLGTLAMQLGQAKLQGIAAEAQHKNLMKSLQEMFGGKFSGSGNISSAATPSTGNILNNTPADMYKGLFGDTTAQTPTKTF